MKRARSCILSPSQINRREAGRRPSSHFGGTSVVQVQELARTLWIKCSVIDKVARGRSEPRRRAVMRENNRWILAGASAGVMLMVLEAVPAELPSGNHWAQAYGRQDKDYLEWNDTCVNCERAQSGGDYSCSNIGIASFRQRASSPFVSVSISGSRTARREDSDYLSYTPRTGHIWRTTRVGKSSRTRSCLWVYQ